MELSTCLWLDGVHVRPGPYCPHGPSTTELGEQTKPGWTVQQADTEGPL